MHDDTLIFFSFSHLPLLQVLSKIGVDGEPLQLCLGQDLADVHHLRQGQVQALEGRGPGALIMKINTFNFAQKRWLRVERGFFLLLTVRSVLQKKYNIGCERGRINYDSATQSTTKMTIFEDQKYFNIWKRLVCGTVHSQEES